ncbi:hypothetical protein GQE99_14685 [Maritimibacter sp. DP07]|uniref:Lipoprotein n=1 Tax=Maritimibacter harenae TaxID=2606218 RepID=A0A845M2K0_9RHOB|nr:hypothetical protein [Maritimibacter harenae]MZR14265.1 hypothetical protein [Maritimibacter harenae]
MRAVFLGVLAVGASLPGLAPAQPTELVQDLTTKFFEACNDAVAAPKTYLAEARAALGSGTVEVTEDPSGTVVFVRKTDPPGEIGIRFGQIAADRMRIFCQVAHFNDAALLDAAATEDAFNKVIEADDRLKAVGGASGMKSLLAGGASQTGMMVKQIAQLYNHVVVGWSQSDLLAQVAIQTNMYEIYAETTVDENLSQVE